MPLNLHMAFWPLYLVFPHSKHLLPVFIPPSLCPCNIWCRTYFPWQLQVQFWHLYWPYHLCALLVSRWKQSLGLGWKHNTWPSHHTLCNSVVQQAGIITTLHNGEQSCCFRPPLGLLLFALQRGVQNSGFLPLVLSPCPWHTWGCAMEHQCAVAHLLKTPALQKCLPGKVHFKLVSGNEPSLMTQNVLHSSLLASTSLYSFLCFSRCLSFLEASLLATQFTAAVAWMEESPFSSPARVQADQRCPKQQGRCA